MIRYLLIFVLVLPLLGASQTQRRRMGDASRWPINITFANGIRPLVGSTWSVSGGYAVNTPAAGTNLVSNPGFDTDTIWNKEANWGIVGGVAMATNASSRITQSGLGFEERWYQIAYTVTAISGGTSYARQRGSPIWTSNTTGTFTNIGLSAAGATLFAIGGTALTASIDNAFLGQLTLSELLATTKLKTDIQISIKASTHRTSSQAGIVLRLNSSSNPTDFIICYLDGANLRVDSCSNGIYTSRQTTATAFVANATLTASINETTFKCFYNGSQVGTAITIDDARLNNNTYAGIFSTDPANTFVSFSAGNSTPSTTAP